MLNVGEPGNIQEKNADSNASDLKPRSATSDKPTHKSLPSGQSLLCRIMKRELPSPGINPNRVGSLPFRNCPPEEFVIELPGAGRGLELVEPRKSSVLENFRRHVNSFEQIMNSAEIHANPCIAGRSWHQGMEVCDGEHDDASGRNNQPEHCQNRPHYSFQKNLSSI